MRRKSTFKWFAGTMAALYLVTLVFFYELPFGSTIYKDVPSGHYAVYEIEYMYNQGFMKGRDETVWNFYPEKSITRAELVSLMLKINGVNAETLVKPADGPFADVPNAHWAAADVAEAAKRQLIPFDVSSGFRPDQPVTRGELANAVVQTLQIPLNTATVSALPDIVGHPYEKQIRTLVANQYAKGNTDGNFKPDDTADRSATAYMFAKALKDLRPDLGNGKKGAKK
ncbi:hypothetical protein CIG75_02085 [Tumebacillus algifaecis]|uniref:SLH domain-containing protein n=1 Tax=Tumebacillus algifaecis TaxID=1214604 RepID=A0A223CWZ2_9BACL|nr:S-layer homology domain-containing protein [Tumebacillus algifaecis]ASS73879.1 hypothetical protein CIG75_02085 [Tumebacillus algifaecis]